MSFAPPFADESAHLLRVAHALADAAAAESLRWFRQPIAIETKADASPVTLADRAAETAMRALLAAERPGDGIYGEEHGAERLHADAIWVLDPIDGTRSFITGSPLWGTLIALMRGGRAVLGVIDMPVLGERWVGHAGTATRNGVPVRVRDVTTLAEARIVTTSPDIFAPADWQAFNRLSRQCAMRRFGGDCYGYAQLAGGTIDLVVEAGLQPYDYLGPCGLIEAAGGIVTDWQGRALGLQSDGRVVAAATPELHRAALALLSAGSGDDVGAGRGVIAGAPSVPSAPNAPNAPGASGVTPGATSGAASGATSSATSGVMPSATQSATPSAGPSATRGADFDATPEATRA